jgi:hypothetical protein
VYYITTHSCIRPDPLNIMVLNQKLVLLFGLQFGLSETIRSHHITFPNIVYNNTDIPCSRNTGMHRIMTFQSMMDCIYNSGPIVLYYFSILYIIIKYYIIILTIVLQLPTVFSTVTCCTGL